MIASLALVTSVAALGLAVRNARRLAFPKDDSDEPSEETHPEPEVKAEAAMDALLKLWQGAQVRRTDRRAYEWKVTLALWASELLIINSLVDYKATRTEDPSVQAALMAGGAAFLVIVVHGLWLFRFIDKAMTYDRLLAISYEKRIHRMAGTTDIPLPPEKRLFKTSVYQSAVTAGLAILAVIVFLRA